MRDLEKVINDIPLGYSTVVYQNKTYSLSKNKFNNGKSYKVYAKELGGNDFISFNSYLLESKTKLCPCEMPEEKVLDFLSHYVVKK